MAKKKHGQYVPLSGRWIYFPAFENERLEAGKLKASDDSLAGPPFWSCTFTALMHAINFAFLGDEDETIASQQEIVDLARASKDKHLRDGGTTTQMLTAMKNRIGRSADQEALRPNDIAKRLQEGQMVVAGLRSKDLSDHFRRFIGNSGALHRSAFVGFRMSGGKAQTRFLDPMAIPSKKHFPNPRRYAGEWFPLDDYVKCAFSNQQLWFTAGEFLRPTPGTVKRTFAPPRHMAIHPGATISSYDADHPQRPVRRATFGPDGSGTFFSALVTATVDGKKLDFLMIDRGKFKGELIRLDDPGITANVTDQVVQPLPAPPLDDDTPDPVIDVFDSGFVVPPGREAPPDRSGAISTDEIDDPAEEGPAEEDALAVDDPTDLDQIAGKHLAPVVN